MWCTDCRQDVPALLSGDKESFYCPRCGADLCANSDVEQNSDGAAVESTGLEDEIQDGDDPNTCFDDWELEEQLHDIGRALHSTHCDGRESNDAHRRESMRFDRPHAELSGWHPPLAERLDKQRKTGRENHSAASPLTWFSLAIGTSGFVCGGVLMGWSLAAERPELWTIGLPAALVGQIVLLIGLVLQLDRMRRDGRRSASKLDEVDEQLHDLRTAATLLSASQGPASTTFYSHFAGGAGPQLLLADLKSQLDLLATRISRKEIS